MGGAAVMVLIIVLMTAITFYLVGTLAKSIRNEKKTSMKLWKNFGLSLAFCALFLLSWVGQGAAQWQRFTDWELGERTCLVAIAESSAHPQRPAKALAAFALFLTLD